MTGPALFHRRHDDGRKALWQFPLPVVDDADPTPFQMTACAAQMFDRTGVFGTVTVTALENSTHTVDLRKHGHGV
ncbi:hypothetical protein AAFP30_06775 [Gordonia sp. CPCC 205515]|uniref:hypothetical protein n=1 Tax=Gordonia sp. CPCC 205515 TaxID=3140791 RepID=UPI003AF36F1B